MAVTTAVSQAWVRVITLTEERRREREEKEREREIEGVRGRKSGKERQRRG